MEAYRPYQYNGKTMLIDRFVILQEQLCREEQYDIFQTEPDRQIKNLLSEGIDPAAYPVFCDTDQDFFSSFRRMDLAVSRQYYLYTQIYSSTKTRIIVNISCERGKLWVNGKCLSIHSQPYLSQYYLTIYLNKGVNHFLLELLPSRKECRFSLQLRNYKFETGDDYRALSQVSHLIAYDPLILISDPLYLPDRPELRMMYLTNSQSYREEYQIEIHDSKTGFTRAFQAKLNEPVSLPVEEFRNLDEETLRLESIVCTFQSKAGQEHVSYIGLILKDFTARAAEINDRLERAAREQSYDLYQFVRGKIKRQQEITSPAMYPEKFLFSYQNYEILPVIENWQFPNEFYKTPGVHEFFIHSDLDDSFVRIQIRVPQNYDPDAAYPAIIAFSTYNDGSNSGLIQEQELAEPCLCFDVTGRGFTGGSYVGEASIFEVLAWIRKSYRLDENRLYFIGQSNGGYATYALAQNHPSLPAAICPQISYPQIETVCNICNIPTYQLVSDCDRIFTGRENEVLGRLKKYGYYKQYDFKSMLHHHLSPYLTHKRLLNDLLAHHRNPYPDTVVYKTCRNRHLESYWVRLHGIERQKKYASVKAEIVDSHTIRLRVSGAYGVTVTLPPQIDRSDFRIIVNTKEFSYRSYDRPRVMLERKGTWRLTEQEGYPDYRKGTGLLDVYLKPMRIILPENASEGLSAVAEHFAHPYTNGLAPKVCVDYPVYTPSEVPDHIFSYSLILLDQAGQNPYAVRLKDRLPVQCDDAGYTYQGSRYDGDYVVMQVIPEPCDCRRSILVVSLNNESLLKRHILLRKVILPFYTTGLHGLWNNEAVIFDGKKYGCIYEAGDPIRLL